MGCLLQPSICLLGAGIKAGPWPSPDQTQPLRDGAEGLQFEYIIVFCLPVATFPQKVRRSVPLPPILPSMLTSALVQVKALCSTGLSLLSGPGAGVEEMWQAGVYIVPSATENQPAAEPRELQPHLLSPSTMVRASSSCKAMQCSRQLASAYAAAAAV